MKKQLTHYALLGVMITILMGCEDVIDIKLQEGQPQLTVDAWVDISPRSQQIRLTMSGDYFSNQPNPAATGASVTLTNITKNTSYTFEDQDNGDYTYDGSTQVLGEVGDQLRLDIAYDGEVFTADTEVFPAAPIDSLIWKYEEESLLGPEGHYVEVFAKDIPGVGNAYWFKTFKNGEFIDDPNYLNYAFDGAFDPGFGSDGLTFITPIRFGLLNYIDAEEPDIPPYDIGDRALVEIHGIHPDARRFLAELQEQVTNGGLFATPAYNISTNISNTNPGSEVLALGFFNVSHIESAEVVVGQ